jgi:hypothetical protein
MQIALFACIPDVSRKGFVRRARIVIDVSPHWLSDPEEDDNFVAPALVDYLPGGVAHDSCCHATTIDPSAQLLLDLERCQCLDS